MALTDPQSITITGVNGGLANSLPRVASEKNSSTYQSADGNIKLTLSHAYGRRNRRVLRIDFKKIASDVFTAQNAEYSTSIYMVVDAPPTGFTNTELKNIIDGWRTMMAASTDAQINKLLGGES